MEYSESCLSIAGESSPIRSSSVGDLGDSGLEGDSGVSPESGVEKA